MWRKLASMTVIAGLCAFTPLHAAPNESAQDVQRQKAQEHQQQRLQALIKRGRLSSYRQLLATGKVHAGKMSAYQAEMVSRDAAIDLAALGFTAADVTAYKQNGVDLFDVARRFFQGVTSSSEAMLMADTVLVATAGEVQEGRGRTDGFLSEVPFTVVKSLKGTRASGDVIRVPLNSGPLPSGRYLKDFTDTEFTTGRKYLLVLSKNWYEQFVALNKKQAEVQFTALPYDAYEVADNGQLTRRSRTMQAGTAPKDIRSVEAALNGFSRRKGAAK